MPLFPAPTWAMLELYGHQRVAGLCQDVTAGDHVFVRCDVPMGESWACTQFLGAGSIFRATVVSEMHARHEAEQIECPNPVNPWSCRYALTLPHHDEDEVDTEPERVADSENTFGRPVISER